jgi:hypothetical protein
MKNVRYVAGTVDCVYPRPVEGDRFEDVINFVENNDEWIVGFVSMTNGFDSEGNYVKMNFNGYDEDEGNINPERDPLFRNSYSGYSVSMSKKYSYTILTQVADNTIIGLLKTVRDVSRGTMIVRFDSSYGRVKNVIKTFKIAVGE